MNNSLKPIILSFSLFAFICLCFYFLTTHHIIQQNQNIPQLLLSTITLCLGLFGVLKVEHWRKDKIRGAIFTDCVNLKKQ